MTSKLILLIFLFAVAVTSAQTPPAVSPMPLPALADVQQIDTTKNEFRFLTPGLITRMWPRFRPAEGGGAKATNFQFGTVTLKDGTVLKWRSSHFGNFTLYDDNSEQLFVMSTSLWDDFGERFVYIVITMLLFVLILGIFIAKRNQVEQLYLNSASGLTSDYLKFLAVRLLACLVFAALAYLLVQGPLQDLHDGVVEVQVGGGHRVPCSRLKNGRGPTVAEFGLLVIGSVLERSEIRRPSAHRSGAARRRYFPACLRSSSSSC